MSTPRRAPLREIPFEVFDRFMSEAPPELPLSLDPEAACPCGAHEEGEHAKGCPLQASEREAQP